MNREGIPFPAACPAQPAPVDLQRMNDTTTRSRLEALKRRISGCRGLLVAFSGGVDSGLLAALAQEVTGGRVHAVFIDSPLAPRSALHEAGQMARYLGLPLEVITLPFPDVTICINQPDRCYHCKKSWAGVLKMRAKELGFSCIGDGANSSDLAGHRPGIRAFTEEGIIHPFIEAGMTKEDIRIVARELGLPFWDKTPAACLATRIPYGEPITEQKIHMIESAEGTLRREGFSGIRVRSYGGIARIEVPGEEMQRLVAMRNRIVPLLKEAGFSYVTVDLEGFRSGSMDEVLGIPISPGRDGS